jgi:hypothetical protein
MSGQFIDLIGTSNASIQVEKAGVKLKNSSGNLLVRNAADNADAELTTSKLNNSGNSIVLNSDAAESGADWKATINRAASGMSANLNLTLPANQPSTGQVISYDSAGNGTFISLPSSASSLKLETTSLAFGSTSPVSMFSTGSTDVIDEVDVIIDTAFDGTPSLSIGISGSTSKYMGATQVDLTAAGTTTFKVCPGLTAQGVEALIATYSAGGSTVGAARIIVKYATPA